MSIDIHFGNSKAQASGPSAVTDTEGDLSCPGPGPFVGVGVSRSIWYVYQG